MNVLAFIAVVACATDLVSGRVLQQSQGSPPLSLSFVPEFDCYPDSTVSFSHVISIRAPPRSVGTRAPVSLTAVLDVSGSMQGEKLRLMKASTDFVIKQLQSTDSVGIISYATNVNDIALLTPATSPAKADIVSAVNRLEARGSTNLSGGLFRGVEQQVEAGTSEGTVRNVLVLTDGQANAGITSISQITSRLESELAVPNAPNVYTLGFGDDHDRNFLQAIADTGKGSNIFIENEEAIAGVFGQIIGGLLTVAAQNIKLTLRPLNGAIIRTVTGGDVTRASGIWMTRFADLFAEEQRDILVNMDLTNNRATEKDEVLSVTLEYFDSVKQQEETQFITVQIGRQGCSTPEFPNPEFEITRLRFKVSEDLAIALRQKESGDTSGATATLDGTLEDLEGTPASQTPQIKALVADVEKVKKEVMVEQDLTPTEAIGIQASADSLSTQRGFGTASLVADTPVQKSLARRAEAFVSGG